MTGIDPNNILERWLRATRRGTDQESVLADARREPPASLKHAIQDRLQAIDAQPSDDFLVADRRAILELSTLLGF